MTDERDRPEERAEERPEETEPDGGAAPRRHDRDRPRPQRPGQPPQGPPGPGGDRDRPRPQRPGQPPQGPPGSSRDRDRPRSQRPGRPPEGPPGGEGSPGGERAGTEGTEEVVSVSEWRVRRILVALDASPASRAAATTAARLAAHLRAELAGLFVEDSRLARLIPGAREVGSYSAADRPLGDDEVRRRLRAQAERARRLFERSAAGAAVRGTFRVVRGTVAREVAAAAREGELLSLGRIGTGHSRLGSVARAALSQGRGPLLLLPPGGVVAPPVVAVYGGGAAGLRTLSAAARLCRPPRLRRGAGHPGVGEPAEPAGEPRPGGTAREDAAGEGTARGWGTIPWRFGGAGAPDESRRQAPRHLEAPSGGRSAPSSGAGAPRPSPPVLRPGGRPPVPRPPELLVLLTPTDPAHLAEHEEEARIFLREAGIVPRFLHPRPAPSDAGRRQLLDRHLLTRAVALERANVLVLPTDSPLAAPDEIETVVESLDCAVLLLR